MARPDLVAGAVGTAPLRKGVGGEEVVVDGLRAALAQAVGGVVETPKGPFDLRELDLDGVEVDPKGHGDVRGHLQRVPNLEPQTVPRGSVGSFSRARGVLSG